MDNVRLIVDHIHLFPEGQLVIFLGTANAELRNKWREMSIAELKAQFVDKEIHIFGEGYEFRTSVLSVEIMNSIADFKNVALQLENNELTLKIQEKDEVEVEL